MRNSFILRLTDFFRSLPCLSIEMPGRRILVPAFIALVFTALVGIAIFTRTSTTTLWNTFGDSLRRPDSGASEPVRPRVSESAAASEGSALTDAKSTEPEFKIDPRQLDFPVQSLLRRATSGAFDSQRSYGDAFCIHDMIAITRSEFPSASNPKHCLFPHLGHFMDLCATNAWSPTDPTFQGYTVTVAAEITTVEKTGAITTLSGRSVTAEMYNAVQVPLTVETELFPEGDLQSPASFTALTRALTLGPKCWLMIEGAYVMHVTGYSGTDPQLELRKFAASGEILFARRKPSAGRQVSAWLIPTDFAIIIEHSRGRLALAYRDPKGRIWQSEVDSP